MIISSQLRKALMHPLTVRHSVGSVSVLLAVLWMSYRGLSDSSFLFILSVGVSYVGFNYLMVIFLNYNLLSGKWILTKWINLSFYYLAIPSYIYLGFFLSLCPKAFYFGSVMGAFATMSMGGYAFDRYFIYSFLMLLTSFTVFLGLQSQELVYNFYKNDHLSFVLLIFVFYYLGNVNNFFKKQNNTNARLLRTSRADKRNLANERNKSEKLLLNILPKDVANELKENGQSTPKHYDSVSVMFTDFVGFTKVAKDMEATKLVDELDGCFSFFDSLTKKYNLEKIKTIGDSYMTCGGIPNENNTHAIDSVLAALEIQSFMQKMKEIKQSQSIPYWELRLGVHTGPLVAGVIGEMKFAYDVFGDTVNTASRMESSGTQGRINISESTYSLVSPVFECEYRGKIMAKNQGMVDMYYVNGLKKDYSKAGDGRVPNDKFFEFYDELCATRGS